MSPVFAFSNWMGYNMRQIVITEAKLDQLVGEAQDRLEQRIRNACGYFSAPERERSDNVIKHVGGLLKRLGEDIKDAT